MHSLHRVAYKFIMSEDPERVRTGSAIIKKDHFPPVQRVADVSEPIADLPYMPPEKLEKWRAERDAKDAREASKKES